jgi:hypothetical protein
MRLSFAAAALVSGLPIPGFDAPTATARVAQVNERGFIVQLTATAPAAPGQVWGELVNPADWWDPEHSFSGDAANFSLDAKPGGCFCETLPAEEQGEETGKGTKKAAPRGGVEHMRVVYVEKNRALRMLGALGPLQSDAVVGTLTVQLKPAKDGEGTQILWEYVVGGFSRVPMEAVAASVDKVLGEQILRLAGKLGAKVGEAPQSPPADEGTPADRSDPPKPAIIGR